MYCGVLLVFLWPTGVVSNTGDSGVTGSHKTVKVKVGDDAILPCQLASNKKTQKVEWTRNDKDVHLYRNGKDDLTNQDKHFKNRTALFHDEMAKGNISLKLSKVNEQDGGNYTCRVDSSQVIYCNILLNVEKKINTDHQRNGESESKSESTPESEPETKKTFWEYGGGIAAIVVIAIAIAIAICIGIWCKCRNNKLATREETNEENQRKSDPGPEAVPGPNNDDDTRIPLVPEPGPNNDHGQVPVEETNEENQRDPELATREETNEENQRKSDPNTRIPMVPVAETEAEAETQAEAEAEAGPELVPGPVPGPNNDDDPEIVCSSKPVKAVIGKDVILQCHLEPPLDATNTTVEWSLGHFNHIIHHYQDRKDNPDSLAEQRERFEGRTSLFHEGLIKGNLSLKLSSLRLSDTGRYRCSFHTEKLQNSCYVNLTVGGFVDYRQEQQTVSSHKILKGIGTSISVISIIVGIGKIVFRLKCGRKTLGTICLELCRQQATREARTELGFLLVFITSKGLYPSLKSQH